MKINDLRDLTDNELVEKIDDLRNLLFKSRFESHDDQAKNPGEIRTAKRDIARIKTLLRERGANAEAAAAAAGTETEQKAAPENEKAESTGE